MARSYNGLMAQIKRLQAQAHKLDKARAKAIERVNRLIEQFEIKADEIVFGPKARGTSVKATKRARPKARKRAKVAPKYRGPGGATWTGRGLMPIWLRDAVKKGKKKDDFLIKKA